MEVPAMVARRLDLRHWLVIMRAAFANVAQLAEHRIRNAMVVGSNPTVGSTLIAFK